MWFDEPQSERVSKPARAGNDRDRGAQTLATACPFCLNTMTDGMAGMAGGENVRVLDIAELLLGRQVQADPRIK